MTSISNEAEAMAQVDQGIGASRANDGASAIEKFRKASELRPRWGIPHFLIGAELAQAGRMAEAEAAYANAVLLEPGLEIARYQLGLLQYGSGRMAVALVTWQPLFGLSDDGPLQRFVHGFAALAQEAFDEALKCFREGLARRPDNEPLAADIRKVIEAIEQRGTPAGPDKSSFEPPRPDMRGVPGPGKEDIHVLLANYAGKRLVH